MCSIPILNFEHLYWVPCPTSPLSSLHKEKLPGSRILLQGSWQIITFHSHHISSVIQSIPTLYDPMDCSTPGLAVYHQLPELAETHVHRAGDAIQSPCPLSSPSPPANPRGSGCFACCHGLQGQPRARPGATRTLHQLRGCQAAGRMEASVRSSPRGPGWLSMPGPTPSAPATPAPLSTQHHRPEVGPVRGNH